MKTQPSTRPPKNMSVAVCTEIRGSLILTFPQNHQLSEEQTLRIQNETLMRCSLRKPAAVIFDLSALEMIDLTEWEWLYKFGQSIRLMGSDAWFVGINPAIIMTLVTLGANTQGQRYALGVEDALLLIEAPST